MFAAVILRIAVALHSRQGVGFALGVVSEAEVGAVSRLAGLMARAARAQVTESSDLLSDHLPPLL